eukprot:evm.model.scf_60.18 EVM.evm.TU.scf_60.18   scf_60:136198-139196(+)
MQGEADSSAAPPRRDHQPGRAGVLDSAEDTGEASEERPLLGDRVRETHGHPAAVASAKDMEVPAPVKNEEEGVGLLEVPDADVDNTLFQEVDLHIKAVNVQSPHVIPDAVQAWSGGRRHMIAWLCLSIVLLAVLIWSVESWLGPIVAIVGSIMYLCPRATSNLRANAKSIMICSVSAFLLDFFFGLRLILLGAAFAAEGMHGYLGYLLPGLALFLHSLFCMVVFRKATEMSVRIAPVHFDTIQVS